MKVYHILKEKVRNLNNQILIKIYPTVPLNSSLYINYGKVNITLCY